MMLDAFYEELDKQRRDWAEERLRPLLREPLSKMNSREAGFHFEYLLGVQDAMRALGVEP